MVCGDLFAGIFMRCFRCPIGRWAGLFLFFLLYRMPGCSWRCTVVQGSAAALQTVSPLFGESLRRAVVRSAQDVDS